MSDQQCPNIDQSKRSIPSFIEPRPPLILNPFMRPRPQKGVNLLELFEEDSESDVPEWVQVYLRLRPCSVPSNLYEVKSERCLVTSVDTAPMGHGRRTQHNVSKMYTFSHIFGPESNQKEIFDHVVKDNLKKLTEGHNFTLLTYGASGSGKTYTLMGTVQAPGLVPRSLEYVFRIVNAAQQPLYKPSDGGSEKLDYYIQDYELQFVKRLRQVSAPLRDKYRRMSVQLRNDLTTSTLDLTNRTRYYVWVSFIEIYNEAIYDLLSNSDRSKASSKLRIREDSNGNVFVKGATQAFVRSGEEAYDVLVAGKHNLQVAATGVHAHSSRSHCIFSITMLTETDEGVRTSCVRLCDLAGSERARQTKNTGARMQESRAINSSLHVLERCLHMLRRKQKKVDVTLVPYRESKLTRLLGAGLCGARGEAVSMLVTLNPSPHYAHETRHVLQLAAVARDIQVNQTIAESTLETISTQDQDTTVETSTEVMKLRSENERLHFELVQAQARNKELLAAMEEKQQEVAKTMFEIVEEAKDMTRQYYETQLQALRTEMEEMQDEYESRLKSAAVSVNAGTPSKTLQRNAAELILELEDQLTAEKLARARAEEELQYLRACIEERDEKAAESSAGNEDVMTVDSESDDDDDDDPHNESLEPTFKREDLNRSKLLQQRQNTIIDHSPNSKENDGQDSKVITTRDENDADMNSSCEESDSTSKMESTIADNPSYESSNDVSGKDMNSTVDFGQKYRTMTSEIEADISKDDVLDSNTSQKDLSNNEVEFENAVKGKSASIRGTYVVRDQEVRIGDGRTCETDQPKEYETNINNTTFISDLRKSVAEVISKDNMQDSKNCMKSAIAGSSSESPEGHSRTNDLRKAHKLTNEGDVSLAQFEQLEKDMKTDESNTQSRSNNELLSNIKILQDKRTFFDDKGSKADPFSKSDKGRNYFDNNEDNNKSDKKTDTANVLDTHVQSHSSKKLLSKLKMLQEKRNYFDDEDDKTDLLPKPTKNKTYFDNVVVNTETVKKTNEANFDYDDRSPSIVKDDGGKNVEPSMIQKLLSESFTRQQEVISSVHKLSKPTKHVSVDIFEGFDSPKIAKAPETSKIDEAKSFVSDKSMDTKTKTVTETSDSILPTSINFTKSIKLEKKDSYEDRNDKILVITDFEKPGGQSKDNMSIFEKCVEKSVLMKDNSNIVENYQKSIKNMVVNFESFKKPEEKSKITDIKIKQERVTIEPEKDNILINNETQFELLASSNDTIDNFEKIYNDISAPRATEFNLLVSQLSTTNISDTTHNETDKEKENIEQRKYNLRRTKANTSGNSKDAFTVKRDKSNDKKSHHTSVVKESEIKDSVDKVKSNINKKNVVNTDESRSKNDSDKDEETNSSKEVLLERQDKCQSQAKTKKALRLRRQKNLENETDNGEKLKEIVNLQKEFSDVTLDVPAPLRKVKDIESPEKLGEEENLPPLLGIQSCPSKSVTRSRRKLFTPRAEPLEESMAASGDSNERVRVPRPSYHRTRARRKL